MAPRAGITVGAGRAGAAKTGGSFEIGSREAETYSIRTHSRRGAISAQADFQLPGLRADPGGLRRLRRGLRGRSWRLPRHRRLQPEDHKAREALALW